LRPRQNPQRAGIYSTSARAKDVFSAKDASQEARIGGCITVTESECWAWKGNLDKYGWTYYRGGMPAHRAVWWILRGPIESDLALHHECRNRGCVNPDHLTPLTTSEHSLEHARLRRAGY
jgi:hypothetical protein